MCPGDHRTSREANWASTLRPNLAIVKPSLQPSYESTSVMLENTATPGSSLSLLLTYCLCFLNHSLVIFSRLSPEACEVLQEFYLKLRRENKTPEGTPITTRQLESLIRLAEARAKLELQEVVTANHARVCY